MSVISSELGAEGMRGQEKECAICEVNQGMDKVRSAERIACLVEWTRRVQKGREGQGGEYALFV